MKSLLLIAASVVAVCCGTASAQEAVVGAANPDSLFTSSDPHLNANKQVIYHIMKDLLEANHWEVADQYLSARYIQHNPLVKSGRDSVVGFFTGVLHLKPAPIPERMRTQVVSVAAEGDIVTVATPKVLKDPKDPSRTYTTTWFDMWRIKDGKADEHWDCATKG
jgi:predicted SnoaL-like aldol condensation-catalyzing enzyme